MHIIHLRLVLLFLFQFIRNRLAFSILLNPRMFVNLSNSDSLFRVFLQHFLQKINRFIWQVYLNVFKVPINNTLVILANNFIEVVSSKDLTSSQKIVKDNSTREHINLFIIVFILKHFRSDITRCSTSSQYPILSSYKLTQSEISQT